ncbi:MAG: tRNA pseudouridine(55) synthase TruB [Thermoanaerobaculales bacterium]|nr:tRNA pseudouridine(55) synthase TruB [Thermoanaerobaculales bacterium]
MSRRRPSRWNGLLPVFKKTGPTSHDVVDVARCSLRERRIGHTGTLDPMAEGLLLLCVGKATRLQQYLLGWDKTYIGRVRLGWATDTYDAEGERIQPEGTPPVLSTEQLLEFKNRFSGEIEQVPPPYSAKKVGGKKLYELARDGQSIDVEAKKVTVHALELEQTSENEIRLEVTVSSGFYVRSLAHDLGTSLGCGGHLRALERTRIGVLDANDALAQDALEAAKSPEEIIDGPHWIPLERIPLPFPSVDLNPTAAQRFLHGQEVVVLRSSDEPLTAGSPIAVRRGNDLIGVGSVKNLLARGRTVNVQPTLVLGDAPE